MEKRMPEKITISAENLHYWYHEEEMTLSEIADKVDCSMATVYNRMEDHGIDRRTANQDVEAHEVHCEYCGTQKEIPPCEYEQSERFFCDNQCQGEFLKATEHINGENSPWWKGKELVECSNCGDSKKVYPSRLQTKSDHFCDLGCYAEWQSQNRRGEKHHQWDPDSQTQFYTGKWKNVRRRVRERDENTCKLCEVDSDDIGRNLDVHHIRPIRAFSSPSDAHTMDNLIQLCRLCHTFMEHLPEDQQRALLEGDGPIFGGDIGRQVLEMN